MTKRERVYASIRRRSPDAIPWQFDLTHAVRDRLKAYLKTDDVAAALDDHLVCASLAAAASAERGPVPAGCRRDAFGAVWRCDAPDRSVGNWGGHVAFPLREPSLKNYTFPAPFAGLPRTGPVQQARREHPDRFLWVEGSSLFERAWGLCGFQNYLGYIAGEEAFVAELTEKLADYYVAEFSLLKGLGADAVRVADDWGFQGSLMIRAASWRRLFKKSYARLFQAAHAAGLVTMMHSCGKVEEIIPDLIEIGLDVLHPLQPETNDVVRCQREFGKDIAFWGALGSQSTLPFGTEGDIRREVRERLRLFHEAGYILAPAGAAPTETPVEHIVAIADEARAQKGLQ